MRAWVQIPLLTNYFPPVWLKCLVQSYASVAQQAARQSHNLKAVSSSLTGGKMFFYHNFLVAVTHPSTNATYVILSRLYTAKYYQHCHIFSYIALICSLHCQINFYYFFAINSANKNISTLPNHFKSILGFPIGERRTSPKDLLNISRIFGII